MRAKLDLENSLPPTRPQPQDYHGSAGRNALFQAVVVGIACCVGSVWCAPAWGQFPTIEISALSRCVAPAGSSFELRIEAGQHTEECRVLVFSPSSDPTKADGISSQMQTAPGPLLSDAPVSTGTFSVKIGPDVPPGLYEVRAVGRFGISNPRRFLVTSKPVEIAGDAPTNVATATELPQDSLVLDRCKAQQQRYYQIQLAAGDTLQLAAYAQALDSRALLTTVLYDPTGRELARHRALGTWPAELRWVAEVPGTYSVAIHDFLYRGGSDYPFLLEAVATGQGNSPPALEAHEHLRPTLLPFDKPAVPQADDASTLADAQTPAVQTVPFVVSGRFSDPRQPALYDFQAAKGQTLWIEVHSARREQLTDPYLILYQLTKSQDAQQSATLKRLADSDDGPTLGGPAMRLRQRDPILQWTAPADGTYRIELRDQEAGRRPEDARTYQLSVREPEPDFELLAYRPFPSTNIVGSRAVGSNLMRGGTESIQVVTLRRDGFSGRIEVSVEGLPAGTHCPPIVIPPGATEGSLTVSCADDAADWTGELQVVGTSQVNGQSLRKLAGYGAIVWPASPERNAIRSRRASGLLACVNAQDTAPLTVQLADDSTLEVAQGAKLPIPIQVVRRQGGAVACLLRARHLPPKTSLGDVTIKADQDSASAELKVAADAPVGEYTFWMQNETKVKWRANPQAVQRAEAYLAKLKSAREMPDPPAEKQALEAAIEVANKQLEEARKQAAEKDYTVWLPTTPVRIRIVAPPKS